MGTVTSLFAGRILEEQLFPYAALGEKDREVLGQMLDAIDQFFGPKHADFKAWDRAAAQSAEFIQGLRDLGLLGRMAANGRRIACNEDEEMDRLAKFILDNGRYPWDVVT